MRVIELHSKPKKQTESDSLPDSKHYCIVFTAGGRFFEETDSKQYRVRQAGTLKYYSTRSEAEENAVLYRERSG